MPRSSTHGADGLPCVRLSGDCERIERCYEEWIRSIGRWEVSRRAPNDGTVGRSDDSRLSSEVDHPRCPGRESWETLLVMEAV